MGCKGSLVQQSQSVRVSPVSEQYKLNKRIQGRAYIFLAETSTGQEQHRYAVSDSLALALSGADYIVLPCLLDIKRWSKGRLSVAGVRFLQTQVVSGILGLEIWDTRTGRKVFSATSDVTLASERVKEEPMPMEEAFTRAWYGIMQKLPGELVAPPVNTAGIHKSPNSPEKNNQLEQPVVTGGEVAKAGG